MMNRTDLQLIDGLILDSAFLSLMFEFLLHIQYDIFKSNKIINIKVLFNNLHLGQEHL